VSFRVAANTTLYATTMIKIIDKQEDSWRIEINGIPALFTVKPIALFVGNDLFPLTGNCDNGLRWRIKYKWISYNQIKKAIRNNACPQNR